MHCQCAFYHALHGACSSAICPSIPVSFSVAVATVVVVIGIAIIITVMTIVESAPPYAAIWVALSVRLPSCPPRRPQQHHLPQRHRHQHRQLLRRRYHHRCGHWHRHQHCHCHRRVSFTYAAIWGGGTVRCTVSAPFIMPSTAPPAAPFAH